MNSLQTIDESHPVGVIGGGLGGLAAACTMAARGLPVVLIEKNDWVGGKAAVLEEDGFRFDMGPTILTLPSVLRRIFSEAGRDLASALDLIPLDPQWRCVFDDGATLDLCSDRETMTENLDRFSGDGKRYEEFLDFSEKLHEISDRFFFWRSVGSVWDTFSVSGSFQPSVLADLVRMRPGQSVAGAIRSFVSDERVAQMLDHFTQYVGSAPDASPAVLCGIAHMQTSEGVWYPRGGINQVPRALRELAASLGVQFRTGVEVTRIHNDGEKVQGLELSDGTRLPVSRVLSNMDSVRVHRELVEGRPARRFLKRRKYEPACSGVVLYLGLEERYDHLLHHNFIFSEDAEVEFDSIYRKGEAPEDPTCYVCAPAVSDPSVAPQGGEALYVLVHMPYLRPHHDWSKDLPRVRKLIIDKLERTGGLEDLEKRIVFERTLTPQDIHDRYKVLDGAIYGIASHGKFTGAFKPANRSPDLEGLYFAGGAAHPGPGMPMVLMSGWIAADTLCQDVGAAAPAETAAV